MSANVLIRSIIIEVCANKWMFKRSPSAEEKRTKIEFDKFINHDFSVGSESFDLEGLLPTKDLIEATNNSDVAVPIVRDIGPDDTSFDETITGAYNQARQNSYITWDEPHSSDQQVSVGRKPAQTGLKAMRPTHRTAPTTPASAVRSTSTLRSKSASPASVASGGVGHEHTYLPDGSVNRVADDGNVKAAERRKRKAPAHHAEFLMRG